MDDICQYVQYKTKAPTMHCAWLDLCPEWRMNDTIRCILIFTNVKIYIYLIYILLKTFLHKLWLNNFIFPYYCLVDMTTSLFISLTYYCWKKLAFCCLCILFFINSTQCTPHSMLVFHSEHSLLKASDELTMPSGKCRHKGSACVDTW